MWWSWSHPRDKTPDFSLLPEGVEFNNLLLIKNKIDLTAEKSEKTQINGKTQLAICAKNTQGIDLLKQELAAIAGLDNGSEAVILARKRHLLALEKSLENMNNALVQLDAGAVELMAEDLRHSAQAMGSITGEFSSDDLLGEIFSSFCIGK
jgi:tRNA modification GTPase